MAAEFYATTRIKHGTDHTDSDDPTKVRHETKWFEVGDRVTGLSTEDMKALWKAGALEQRGSDDEGTKSESGKGSKPATPATPQSSPGQNPSPEN